MKKLIAALIILVVLACTYFVYGFIDGKGPKDGQAHSQVSLKLLPFPLIISNDGSKNDALLDLLLNKGSKIISINDGRLEFDNLPPFGKKASFDGVFLTFSYDHQNNKVKFSGTFHNAINTEISGDYSLNDKNNIIYNLNFSSDFFKLILSGNYQTLENQDGALGGSFSFSANNSIKLLDFISGSTYRDLGMTIDNDDHLAINGDYEYEENKLHISNAALKSSIVDAVINLDYTSGSNDSLALDTKINYLDLDNLIASYNILKINNNVLKAYFAEHLTNMLEHYNGSDSKFTSKFDVAKIALNGASINFANAKIDSSQNGFVVSKLNFTLPGDSEFTTNGIITANNYRPQFLGKINLISKDLKSALNFVHSGSKSFDLQENIPVTASAQMLITPVLNAFYNLQFTNGNGSIGGDWLHSSYGIQKITHSDINFDGFDFNMQALLKTNPLEDLIKKSNQPGFVGEIMKLKSIESVYDSDIMLKNVMLNNNNLNTASCELVVGPEVVELNGIKVRSNALKFGGNILLNAHGVDPFLDISLKGDVFDPGFIKYLTYTEPSTNGALQPTTGSDKESLSLFRFDKFIGYIQLNFNALQNKYFTANDFNFFASLKDRTAQIEKCNANVFGGNLKLSGNISFAPFSSNFAYSLADADANKIATKIFNNSNFSGAVSIVGSVNTGGDMLSEIENQLTGAMKVQSANLIVDSFNIDSFIAMYGKSQHSAIGKKTNLKLGTTTFTGINGDIVINNGLFSSDKINFETASNINGASSFNFLLSSRQMSSISSFAYVDPEGKIDGFNISLNGPIDRLKLQLGTGSGTK